MNNSAERQKCYLTLRKLRLHNSAPLIPEMREAIMVKDLGAFGGFLDGVLPVVVQKTLARMSPRTEIFQRLVDLNNYRNANNILVSRNPL